MKTLVFDGTLKLEDRAIPEPEPGEALIQILMAGICNTDIEIIRGSMDYTGILGHEFVGLVTSCDDTSWIKKRVVGEINLGCGVCMACQKALYATVPIAGYWVF